MCMLMVLVRLTVCGFLLYAGTLYLVGTIDMRDLLLNSMALGVVLEVDELVFAALAPDSAREAIECAAPLPYSIIPRFHGLDVKAFLFTCLLLGGAPVVYYTRLIPAQDILNESALNACDGEREFAYATNVLGLVAVVKTRPPESKGPTIVTQAIQEAIDHATPNTSKWAVWRRDFDRDALTRWKSASIAQALQLIQPLPTDCNDLLNKGNDGRVYANWLSILHGKISNCSQLRSVCLDLNWSKPTDLGFVRAMCPHTCGCDSRLSVGIFTLPTDYTGCAGACRSNFLDKYSHSCVDSTPWSYQNKKGWDMIVEYIRIVADKSSPSDKGDFLNIMNLLNTSVCQGVQVVQSTYSSYGWNPCNHGWGIPLQIDSVLNHCPVTCGCRRRIHSNDCPFVCNQVNQSQITQPTP